jgi:hypothetical protein
MKLRYGLVLIALLGAAYLFLFKPSGQRTELLSLIKPLEVNPHPTGMTGSIAFTASTWMFVKKSGRQWSRNSLSKGL